MRESGEISAGEAGGLTMLFDRNGVRITFATGIDGLVVDAGNPQRLGLESDSTEIIAKSF